MYPQQTHLVRQHIIGVKGQDGGLLWVHGRRYELPRGRRVPSFLQLVHHQDTVVRHHEGPLRHVLVPWEGGVSVVLVQYLQNGSRPDPVLRRGVLLEWLLVRDVTVVEEVLAVHVVFNHLRGRHDPFHEAVHSSAAC